MQYLAWIVGLSIQKSNKGFFRNERLWQICQSCLIEDILYKESGIHPYISGFRPKRLLPW